MSVQQVIDELTSLEAARMSLIEAKLLQPMLCEVITILEANGFLTDVEIQELRG